MFLKLKELALNNTPKILSVPLNILPDFAKNKILTEIFNYQFKSFLENGDLNFCKFKSLQVVIDDLNFSFFVQILEDEIKILKEIEADFYFSTNLNNVILLFTQRANIESMLNANELTLIALNEENSISQMQDLLTKLNIKNLPEILQNAIYKLADVIEEVENQ